MLNKKVFATAGTILVLCACTFINPLLHYPSQDEERYALSSIRSRLAVTASLPFIFNSNSTALSQIPKSNDTRVCFAWNTTTLPGELEVESDQWWEHHPDWEVTTEEDSYFCFTPIANSTKSSFFKDTLYANQYNQTTLCNTTIMSTYMWSSGWCSDVSHVAKGLLESATIHHKPFQVWTGEHWHYTRPKKAHNKDHLQPVCPTGDMYCYFLPLGPCAVPLQDKQPGASFNPTLLLPHELEQSIGKWTLEYVTRPQQWLRNALYQNVAKLSPAIQTPCAVVHVRRSDVVLHQGSSRKYFAVQDYLTKLNESRPDLKNIFLLTDDANAIDEAIEFHSDDYHLMYLNRTRHRGSSGGWENQIPSNSPKFETITILSILRLVKKCNVFVHSASGFADIIYSHMVGNTDEQDVLRLILSKGDVMHANNSKTEQTLQLQLKNRRKNNTHHNGNTTTTTTD